jgi:uncharacterized protein YecE (DUF72 family)
MGRQLVGISGWRYAPWRGVFYPRALAQHRELEYASRQLPTIEINGTHYSLQRPECFEAWRAATPPGFVFAVKGSRFITHMKRLNDIERPLANFFAQGVLALEEKLGPLLWQFPPSFRFEPARLEAFFALLPRDTDAAMALARRRDHRMTGRAKLTCRSSRELRHAIEIRHESFRDPAFVKLLRRFNVALVVADTAGKWPYVEDVTADFMYLRLHGDKEIYKSGYDEAALDRWAARIRAWSGGGEPADARKIAPLAPPRRKSRELYCYFDNDMKAHAPFDALGLIDRLAPAAGSEEELERRQAGRNRRNAPRRTSGVTASMSRAR